MGKILEEWNGGRLEEWKNRIMEQRILFVIPVKTEIQHVYGFQNPNWIPDGVYPVPRYGAGMTDGVVALFIGTVAFFLKESLYY